MSNELLNYRVMNSIQHISDSTKIIALSFLIVLTSFLVYQNFGMDLADESFLWYGMIRTAMGDVPIRDFHAYDPGRYYWGALWFNLLGNDGPVAFRGALALLEWIGLTFALLCLKRITKSWIVLVIEGLLIYSWMYVHYKAFDTVVAISAVYFALLLIEKPSLQRHFGAGLFVGFSAFIGINHGLYTSISFCLLIGFLWLKFGHENLSKRLLVWGMGIVIGYSPMLIMFAVFPGFFSAVAERIIAITLHGTNLHIPVLWPWDIHYHALTFVRTLKVLSWSIYFLIFPIFNLLIACYLVFAKPENLKRQSVLIASAFIGFTYIHYAFDRADLMHLSFAVIPLLISLLSLPSSFDFQIGAFRKTFQIFLLVFIFLSTLFSVGGSSPWNKARVLIKALNGHSTGYVQQTVKGDKLWWPEKTAFLMEEALSIKREMIGEEAGVFIAPYPGLYVVLDKKSPTRRLYYLFLESPEAQKEMISQISQAGINWAIIRPDDAIDGRDELRFRNAYASVWKYLTDNFEEVENRELPPGTRLMRRHEFQ